MKTTKNTVNICLACSGIGIVQTDIESRLDTPEKAPSSAALDMYDAYEPPDRAEQCPICFGSGFTERGILHMLNEVEK